MTDAGVIKDLSFQITLVIYHTTELSFPLRCLNQLTPSTASGLSNGNCINYRVQTNDGGTLEKGVGGQSAAHHILVQRLFIFDLLASGLAMAPLQVADFKNTEIVFESNFSKAIEGISPR
ncbi:hypothetical protein CY34DRAFT_123859 [Suillus luteus UH-Slu-Lm8-n1]|uniref:Uncharacterized protein n=1 Tax=Suillus luteus UH-Slu-Lm8-n1 TaxID=930992 RepID=A0A0D0BYZ1_9AGAM|nr:hypothetical protein CY34DRAFT_123859 [Suillus luteus UH-Slu-Lm8-n1]